MVNYIIVTGGVISGLGKGITTASIGKILKLHGYKVTAIKIDPYINCDAGTLRPTEHGEVWVTEDGGEIDQDLGHYERFLDVNIPKCQNITTGQVYGAVIDKERNGKYLGKTVQPIPHVTDEIKARIRKPATENGYDFVMVEIGGTVGDYENVLFLEAVRQMKLEGEKVLYVHVTYVPVIGALGEAKTKPTQHSVKLLREIGIQPDFIIARSEKPIDDVRKDKIALFCNISGEDVISDSDIDNVYAVPLLFEDQQLCKKILRKLGRHKEAVDLKAWKTYINRIRTYDQKVKIGIVGKYFDIGAFKLSDSYISVIEAVKHAAWNNKCKPKIEWIDSKMFEQKPAKLKILDGFDGIIVPGGFGLSGIDGKIATVKVRPGAQHPVPRALLGDAAGCRRVRQEYLRAEGGEYHGGGQRHPVSRHRFHPGPGEHHPGLPLRRHDAAGCVSGDPAEGFPDRQAVQRDESLGAPPASVRGEPQVRRDDRAARAAVHRAVPGRRPHGVHGAAHASVLRRHTGAPGVQIPSDETRAALRRTHQGCEENQSLSLHLFFTWFSAQGLDCGAIYW